MIRITCTAGEGEYRIESRGHAGYNPGNDPVCAAVSAILWTLAGGLRSLVPDSEQRAEADSGRFDVSCHPSSSDAAAVDTIFRMTVVGLLQVEKRYPEYVRVKREAREYGS